MLSLLRLHSHILLVRFGFQWHILLCLLGCFVLHPGALARNAWVLTCDARLWQLLAVWRILQYWLIAQLMRLLLALAMTIACGLAHWLVLRVAVHSLAYLRPRMAIHWTSRVMGLGRGDRGGRIGLWRVVDGGVWALHSGGCGHRLWLFLTQCQTVVRDGAVGRLTSWIIRSSCTMLTSRARIRCVVGAFWRLLSRKGWLIG